MIDDVDQKNKEEGYIPVGDIKKQQLKDEVKTGASKTWGVLKGVGSAIGRGAVSTVKYADTKLHQAGETYKEYKAKAPEREAKREERLKQREERIAKYNRINREIQRQPSFAGTVIGGQGMGKMPSMMGGGFGSIGKQPKQIKPISMMSLDPFKSQRSFIAPPFGTPFKKAKYKYKKHKKRKKRR